MNFAPDLSRQQRAVNLWARYVQRPTLHYIKDIRVLRAMTNLTAPMTYKRPANMLLRHMTLTHDRVSVPATACTIKHQPMDGTLLYLHGGGFVMGSLPMYQHLVASLGHAAGMRGVYTDYRLAPEHPFPAALDDAYAAYRALLADPQSGPIALAGDSAGGNLVLALLLRLKDEGLPLPISTVAICPVVDLAFCYPSLSTNAQTEYLLAPDWGKRSMDCYIVKQDIANPYMSPIHGDFTGVTPVQIHYDSCESLADDGRLMAEHLKAQGVDVTTEVSTGCTHVWHLNVGRTPEADASVARIGTYLRSHLPAVDSVRAAP